MGAHHAEQRQNHQSDAKDRFHLQGEQRPCRPSTQVTSLIYSRALRQLRDEAGLLCIAWVVKLSSPSPLPTHTQEQNVAAVTYHVKLGFNKRSKFHLDDELYDEQNLPSGRDYEQSRSGSRPRWSAASPTCPVRTLSCGANDCESMAPKIPARQHRPHG